MYPVFPPASSLDTAHSQASNRFRNLKVLLLFALAMVATAQPAVRFDQHGYPSGARAGMVPGGIVAGTDGHVWTTDYYNATVLDYQPCCGFNGTLSPTLGTLGGIAIGADGTKWWSGNYSGKVVKWPANGGITMYSVTGHPYAITVAPNGNAWFAEPQEARVGFVTPAGAVTEFPLPASTDMPNSLAVGLDGNLWFTLQDHAAIGRITPAGVVTEFPVAASNAKLRSMAAGPDGALWFVDAQNGNVLQRTANGEIKQFSVLPYLPYAITSGPDGTLWFTASSGTYFDLGRITVDGAVTMYGYANGTSYSSIGITAGPNRTLWFPLSSEYGAELVMAEVLTTPMVQVTTTALPAATVGASYHATLTATGGTPPYQWYAYPLPTGLAVDAATGVISGVPQTPGTYSFPVRATDNQQSIGAKDLSIVVTAAPANAPAVTTKTLPDATQEVAYSQALAATGGVAPYKWAIAAGALPEGMTLNAANGVIGGIPAKIGAYSFIAQVIDSAGTSSVSALALTVVARPVGPPRVGVFSQVASGAGWKTSLYLSNHSLDATDVTLYFWANNGNPVALPLTIMQTGGTQTLNASNWSGTIGANSTVLLETGGPAESGLTGWAEVLSSGTLMSGYGVFHYTSAKGVQSEATVPMEKSAQWYMLVPYELNDGFQAGIAMTNLSCSIAFPGSFTFYDAAGNTVGNAAVNLDPCSHQSFMLSDWSTALNGKRGLLRLFPTGSGDGLTGLGIRVNPAGGITSTPPLTSNWAVHMPNGRYISAVFSHVAAGGGWKTSLYLVNPTLDSSTVTVTLHADQGLPAELALRVVQRSTTSEITASSTTLSLAPSETVLIESNTAPDAAWTGWMELVSQSGLAGYGVFHYTSPAGVESEGTVTLESPMDSGFTLPYEANDNFKMGVALANFSDKAITVTVIAYDANGVNLGASTLDLAATGHKSLMLSDLLPATTGNRGFVQFFSNNGPTITGLGIRVNPLGGFTSAPKL